MVMPLEPDEVRRIKAMNDRGEFPDDIIAAEDTTVVVKPEDGFVEVTGEIELPSEKRRKRKEKRPTDGVGSNNTNPNPNNPNPNKGNPNNPNTNNPNNPRSQNQANRPPNPNQAGPRPQGIKIQVKIKTIKINLVSPKGPHRISLLRRNLLLRTRIY